MSLPWICPECRIINIVDMDRLATRPKNKIVSSKGYACGGCGIFNTLYFTTASMETALEKMDRLDVRHKDFYWHFGKTLKKVLGIII